VADLESSPGAELAVSRIPLLPLSDQNPASLGGVLGPSVSS
jgi:hypothetical protein